MPYNTTTMHYNDLLNKYPLISGQITALELRVILREINKVIEAEIEGDVVEMGCFEGTSALFLQRLLQQSKSRKKLWLYDSFEGLPAKSREDSSPAGEQFRLGELKASKKRLIQNFQRAGLMVPKIKKAWFSELTAKDMPPEIAFAFLDGDFYDSVLISLELVWPKLRKGAMVVIDDYQTEALPGVQRAVDQWAHHHQFSLRSEASLAIIQPVL